MFRWYSFFLFVRSFSTPKIKNKAVLYALKIISISGIAAYISFFACLYGKHLNLSIKYEEMPIEKIEKQWIYFENLKHCVSEKSMIIEQPNDKYKNVVVKETEYFQLQWIVKINTSIKKYHVYMSEDVYDRFKSSLIYEKNNS